MAFVSSTAGLDTARIIQLLLPDNARWVQILAAYAGNKACLELRRWLRIDQSESNALTSGIGEVRNESTIRREREIALNLGSEIRDQLALRAPRAKLDDRKDEAIDDIVDKCVVDDSALAYSHRRCVSCV